MPTSVSPSTEAVRRFFYWAKWVSFTTVLAQFDSVFDPRSEFTQEQIASREFTRRRATAIEMYVLCWIGLEVIMVVLATSYLGPGPIWLKVEIVGLALLRIIEIVQVQVNLALFDEIKRPDPRVALTARTLVLGVVNYIELFLCFGVVYGVGYTKIGPVDPNTLLGAAHPMMGLYVSAVTQLSTGYSDVYPTGWLRLVAPVQGFIALIFLVLVLGRFVASLRPITGIFDQRDVTDRALPRWWSGQRPRLSDIRPAKINLPRKRRR